MIATQLAPLMNNLVSNSQSAFIRRRTIDKNFMYVRDIATRLYKSILRRHGFLPKFQEWIAGLLRSSS
jgi:hypothetical protein